MSDNRQSKVMDGYVACSKQGERRRRQQTCLARGTLAVVGSDPVVARPSVVAEFSSTVVDVDAAVVVSPSVHAGAEVGTGLVVASSIVLTGL